MIYLVSLKSLEACDTIRALVAGGRGWGKGTDRICMAFTYLSVELGHIVLDTILCRHIDDYFLWEM